MERLDGNRRRDHIDLASREAPDRGRMVRSRYHANVPDRTRSPFQPRRGPPRDPVPDDIEENSGVTRWAQGNRGVIMAIMALAAVLLLLIAGLQFLPFDENHSSGEIYSITTFNGGSSQVLINSTFLGDDAYITIPWNATVKEAGFRIAGSLPPEKVSFEAGRNPIDVAVGDVDRDLFLDVVVVNYEDSTLMVLKNEGGTSLVKYQVIPVGSAPTRVELAHLNNDAFIDAVVISEDSRDLRVFINDETGMYDIIGNPFLFPTIPSDLQVMDLESDGDMDVVVSTTNDDNITFFVNDGNGNLVESAKFLTEGNPTRMAVADMDRDGHSDIIVSNRRDMDESIFSLDSGKEIRWLNSVSVFRNQGDGTFSKMIPDMRSQKGISSIDIGDLNGDGWNDIAMSNLGYRNVSYLLSDGTGNFERGSSYEIDVTELGTMDAIQVLLEDLDADGDLDIWAVTRSADSVMFYANDGKGNFRPYVQSFVGVFPTSFEMIDFDLDGDKDIVTSDWQAWDHRFNGNGTVSILENLRDGIFRTYRKYETGNSPRGVFAKDIDLDGDPDISSANYFGSTVSILINDGLGRFFEDREYPIGLEPYAVVLEDFDNDGFVDGASADEANFRIVLLRSNMEGGFTTERFLYDIGAYPFSLRTSDIDNDGDMDLYTSNYFQNSTTLLFNDGSSDFHTMFKETRTIYLGNNMPYDSLMTDIDGDGIKDLITVNRGNSLDPSDTISVMLNDGTFTFTDIKEYKVGKEPTSAIFSDLDNDGDLDIATSDTLDDTFTVLTNDGQGGFTLKGTYHVGDRPQFINTMDIDSDGWMDLLISSSDSNSLALFRNTGDAVFMQFSDLNIASYPYAIDLSDFNSDGRTDMVLTSVNTNSVVVTGCYYYPRDVSINIGADSSIEFENSGLMTEDDSFEIDLKDPLNRYIRENRVKGQDLRVPIRIISQQEGIVSLSNLLVVYTQD